MRCAGTAKNGKPCTAHKPFGIGLNVPKPAVPVEWFCKWHKDQAGKKVSA